MKASEVLRAAADRILSGYCKKALQDKDGNVCAQGAINMVTSGTPWWGEGEWEKVEVTQARSELTRVINDNWPERTGVNTPLGGRDQEIVNFNNHPATTAQEVAMAMEKAAVNLEGSGL